MNVSWKVINFAVASVAGILSDSVTKRGWRIVTGRNPPQDDDLEVGLTELIVFAVLSGILLALTKRFTMKAAAKWYHKTQMREIIPPAN